MLALDTNVIARFYVDDPDDPQAALQRPLARQVLAQGTAFFVPLTVVLELEWVLRAFYGFNPSDLAQVLHHLSALPHVTVQDASTVLAALDDHVAGLDFADALHLRLSRDCEAMVSFDDRKFARNAKRLGLQPQVNVPS